MKILTSLAVLISSILLINASQAQESAFCQGPVITMSAIGEIESLPDVAQISLNVKSQAKDEMSALRGLSANMEKIINVLEALDIKDQDMRTNSINIRPVYDQRNRQEIIAYAGATQIHFKTFELDKITGLMSGVMAGSDNLFSNITYSSNDKDIEDQARKVAFNKAFHKANLYAELAGNELGTICTITEGQVRVMPRMLEMVRQGTMAMSSAPADILIPIKPGKITTTAQVTLVYQLEN